MTRRTPLKHANFYVLLGLDEALDPVTDNARLRRIVEERAAEAKKRLRSAGSAKSDTGARTALVIAREQAMLQGLGPKDATPARPAQIWKDFHQQFVEVLRQTRARQRRRANSVFDMLGTQDVSNRVAKRIRDELGDDELFDEITRSRKIEIADDAPNPEIPPGFETDCSTARLKVGKILPFLDAFAARDVYELLAKTTEKSLSHSSTQEEMAEAITALQEEIKYLGTPGIDESKPLAEIKTTLADLYRESKRTAKVEGLRTIFDDLLKLERELPFFGMVQILKSIETVRHDHVERIVSLGATGTGLPSERVLLLLKGLMKKDGIPIDRWGLTGHFRVCHACGAMNTGTDATCVSCKTELFAHCANCDARFDLALAVCPGCATSTSDGVAGNAALARAGRALSAGKLADTEGYIAEAARLIPRSRALDELTRRLQATRRSAMEEEARLTALVTKDRRMLAALADLSKASAGIAQPVFNRLRNTAEGAVAEAAGLTAEARALLKGSEHDQAEARLRSALSAVTDYDEARALLDRIPPPRPENLVARPVDDAVELSWRPPRTHAGALRYLVVRSRKGLPRSPGEGEEIARTGELSLSDRGCPPGVEVQYAVFSCRGDSMSETAAGSRKVMLLTPVHNLDAVSDEAAIRLTWTLPQGARGAEIRRSPTFGGGSAVHASATAWADESAEPGRRYDYHVAANYAGPDGTEHLASAQKISCALRQAPSTIRAFVHHSNQRVVRWQDAPQAGEEDEVLVFPDGMPLPGTHSLIDRARFASVPAVPAHGRRAMVSVSSLPFGHHRLVVVRSRDGLSRIGPILDVSQLTPLRDLAITVEAAGASVGWTWPAGCCKARLRLRVDRLAPQDVYVRTDSDDRKGHHFIAASSPCEIAVEAFAVVEEDGRESAPVKTFARLVRPNRLSFEITQRKSGALRLGPVEIRLVARLDHAQKFPQFEVRFHPDFKPSAGEGECLWRSEPGRGPTDRQEQDITWAVHGRKGFVNLIFIDPEERDRIEVVPGPHEIR